MQQLNEIAIQDKWRLETEKGKTNLPQHIYTQICNIDPTTKNGNAGKYCDWLLRRVTPEVFSDTDKVRRLRIALEQFNDGKKRGILQQYGTPMDIGQYKTADDLINAIGGIMSQGTAVSQSTSNKMQALQGQYDIVGEDKDWIVVHPKTFEAERYFGSGTEWCTVANKRYFSQYSKQGPLYITFPKNGDNKLKMQFHFESESFADYQDEVYDDPKWCITEVLENNINEAKNLFKLWSSINPEFNRYKYTFFDEVQGLLDRGEDPEEVFDYVGDYIDGYAEVQLNGKWNFINTEGKLLSPEQWFGETADFCNGYAGVELKGKWNFINTKGELVYPEPDPNKWFDDTWKFHYGFAEVALNDKHNFIRPDGTFLYDEPDPNKWFDWVGSIKDGYATVETNGQYKYLDTKGNLYDYDPREQQQTNVLTEAKLRKIIRNTLLEIRETIYKEMPIKW